MARFSFIFLIVATVLGVAPAAAHRDEPLGVWLTEKRDARIKVTKCGNGICGVIVWLKEPIDRATGHPQVDDKNPNPALRKRPVIGISLFIGMRASAPGKWSGQIYNADDGGTYVSHVTFAGGDALRVEGCVGIICGGETWTRVGR
ncbi:DUF2147 domain-containing protein [Bradyrhizobium sp.]|uniref:DUF2147 domain-containing protein n=1 Tax=Bradyrhizobium sp. TaxID=376 RepID=UPI001D8052E3|nr:DUF2147 domain-containing protein [Bradyrhizobium sp.]MBI5321801.1 DUF2147 domain-containing protein [Bradyrhizobium sp.]